MALEQTIGFLGAGKMASALAQGFLRAELVSPGQIIAADPSPEARQAFAEQVGAKTVEANQDVVRSSKVLFLSVKPIQVASVLESIKGVFSPQHLLISIATGITISRLEACLGDNPRIIRVMPNTPALVGASASAFALGQAAHLEDGDLVEKLLSAVGLAVRVKEPLLDAVTGLSGSGPAYVFLIMEALSDGGVAAGLPRPIANQLAAQTLFGSAKLLQETGLHPGALKDMVTSPGGTTAEGLQVLERSAVRGALIEAVRAAAEKAGKLASA